MSALNIKATHALKEPMDKPGQASANSYKTVHRRKLILIVEFDRKFAHLCANNRSFVAPKKPDLGLSQSQLMFNG
jgi:hypothetical protein